MTKGSLRKIIIGVAMLIWCFCTTAQTPPVITGPNANPWSHSGTLEDSSQVVVRTVLLIGNIGPSGL